MFFVFISMRKWYLSGRSSYFSIHCDSLHRDDHSGFNHEPWDSSMGFSDVVYGCNWMDIVHTKFRSSLQRPILCCDFEKSATNCDSDLRSIEWMRKLCRVIAGNGTFSGAGQRSGLWQPGWLLWSPWRFRGGRQMSWTIPCDRTKYRLYFRWVGASNSDAWKQWILPKIKTVGYCTWKFWR